MYQPTQVQEPFQRAVDYIGDLSQETGIARWKFYRYLGSLGPLDKDYDPNYGRLPGPDGLLEELRLAEEDIKAGRLVPIEETIAKMEAIVAKAEAGIRKMN